MFTTHIKTIHRMKHLFTLLTSAALWLAMTAQAQQAREAIPQGQAYTVIANPGEDASRSIRIGWHTDEGSGRSFCFYAKQDEEEWHKAEAAQELCTAYDSLYSKTADNKDFYERARFTRNTVTLDGLEPGTEYVYRVSPENTGETRRFKTAPRRGGWDMALISDFHAYAPIPQRTQAAMDMLHVLEERNGHDLDMVLHAGDVCAWGGSYSFWRGMYEEQPFADYMWAGVNGNHDNMTRNYRLTNEFFRDAAFYPRNGYEGEEGVCYHFRYGDVLFIMLNSEDMRSDEGLAAARKWVREVIEQNPARYTVVCEHYQWFFGQDGNSSQYSRWSDLFDELGVDLALAGNNHIYVRSYPVLGGEVTDGSSGTVYVQTPSSDNERGAASMGEIEHNEELIASRWFEGPKTVGAVHMSVSPKEMVLTLLDRNGTVLDTVSVKAKRK